ncbi:MAG: FHA domain-containing protein [Pirellulaceae bacterium]|nr:FHA domain-containing protein [Pirellulaceae bacterium]
MFQSWRLKVREAEEALKAGRLNDAQQILVCDDLTQYLPGKRLAARIAAQLAKRAQRSAYDADLSAGWRDLQAAAEVAGETSELLDARRALVDSSLRHAEQLLAGGDVAGAIAKLEELKSAKRTSALLETLLQIAKRVQSAENLCRRGKFADAEAQLSAAVALRPSLQFLEVKRGLCRDKLATSRDLTAELHRAISASLWTDALSLADELLELAPESQLARDARRRAWAKVGTRLADSYQPNKTQEWTPSRYTRPEQPVTAGPRFVLWVDGVGGYLVCLADEIVIGQASDGNNVDVPILGDLSRRHVRIRREGEGYVLEPLHAVRVAGKSVQTKTILDDGDEIELGEGIRMRFRRPHTLSGSARLDFLSRHRTQPWADGVLLMAESCVLGPRWQNHVVCRDWSGDVVLYRQNDELYCRAMDSIEIDGALCDGRGRLEVNSHVVGSDFSMSLEELDKCSTQPLL